MRPPLTWKAERALWRANVLLTACNAIAHINEPLDSVQRTIDFEELLKSRQGPLNTE